MSFVLPDIVVESAIRDGLAQIRNNPALLEGVFSSLLSSYSDEKYGEAEVNRLKDFIKKDTIRVVHSFHEVHANLPCFSILLGNEVEAKNRARMDDFDEILDTDFTEPEELAALVKVSPVTVTAYDSASGELSIADAVDLASVNRGMLYEDDTEKEFTILGLSNETGSKRLYVAEGSDVSIAGAGKVKSSIDFERQEIRGNTDSINIIVGVHTKEALLTKYMYTLLKYVLMANKNLLIQRGLQEISYSGTDFDRNSTYAADRVYTRTLTLSGSVENSWESEKVIPIEDVEVNVKVPKATADTEDLDLEDLSVQVGVTEQEDC